MKLFIKIAIRNIQRNIQSTMLNGIGITFSTLILLLTLSISQGIETQIMMRNIRFDTGAISINISKKTASWKNEKEGGNTLNVINTYLKNQREVSDFSQRIYVTHSLLYVNNISQKVRITGLTEKEIPLVSDIFKILAGSAEISDQKKNNHQ